MSSLSHLLKRTFSLNGKKSSNYSFNDVCVCDKLTCKLKCNDNDNDYDDDEREEEMVTLKTHFRATFHFVF